MSAFGGKADIGCCNANSPKRSRGFGTSVRICKHPLMTQEALKMPIVISGHLASSVLSVAERKQFSPQPATGIHAELLVEITQCANALIKLAELEQPGVCDGAGVWVGRDPMLNMGRKLLALTEQRSDQRVSDGTPGPAG